VISLENSTVPVKDKNKVEKLVEMLGEGESEAIVLAQNLGATLLIRDSDEMPIT
jgi:predicted nucleic acid-binding protein